MAGNFVASSSQFLNLSSSLSFPRNLSGLTITCWVTPGTLINTETFILYFANAGSTSAGRASLSVRTGTTKFRLNGRRLTANGISSLDSITNVVAGTTYFLAGVHNYTGGGMILYINGVQDNTLSISSWTANSQDADSGGARIGSRPDGSSTSFQNMVLSDVRCYQRILSVQEIQNMYVAKGKDSIVNGLFERWEIMDGADAGTIGTTRSIGSNQGPAVSGGSPTYTTNLCGTRSRGG